MSKMKLKMSFLAEPSDANYRGNVHGGKVMKWIDEVGYALSVQYSGKYCVTKFVDDIEFLDDRLAKEEMSLPKNKRSELSLKEKIEFVINNDFVKLPYSDAFEILKNCKPNKKNKFRYKIENWGCDLQSEHERFLVEKHFKCPVVVFDYPAKIKAFYMRMNEDAKTVRAMDILFPGIGEIVGGSQREERLDVLEKRIKELSIDSKELWWYLDLRKYGSLESYVPLGLLGITISGASLAGNPYLTGSFSKDFIIELSYVPFTSLTLLVSLLATLTVLFTAYYSDVIETAFEENPDGFRKYYLNSHENSFFMNFPLLFLTLGGIFLGFLVFDLNVGLGNNFYLVSNYSYYSNDLTYQIETLYL